jgi:hypothetical protein
MKSGIVLGMIGVGFALLIASGLWQSLFPPTNVWTPEKASRISEVKARLNELSFTLPRAKIRIAGGPDPATLRVEYDTLTKEFEQLKMEFESATNAPRTASMVLKWSGICLAGIGVIGWYAVKQTS